MCLLKGFLYTLFVSEGVVCENKIQRISISTKCESNFVSKEEEEEEEEEEDDDDDEYEGGGEEEEEEALVEQVNLGLNQI
jgi:hypothetical protein